MTYHASPTKMNVLFPRTKAWTNAVTALTEAERINGMHGYQALGPNEGMLFAFPQQPSPISMTMAKMLIPLDIIFIGGDGLVKHIAHRLHAGRPTPALGPAVPWVLEVPSGFARRHRIVCGDLVIIKAS